MPRVTLRLHTELRVRVAVLAAILAAACAVLALGYDPKIVVATIMAVAMGGVQIACRLTAPTVAPVARCAVLVIVLLVVVGLLGWGYPPITAAGVVLSGAACAAEVSRRMAGQSCRLPRLCI